VSLVVGALLAFVRTWRDRHAVADAATGEPRNLIDGFAAGALIVMLIDSMIPEATRGAGRVAGLATTLGFAVATALSTMS
jgi:ZIP family zinc transporter